MHCKLFHRRSIAALFLYDRLICFENYTYSGWLKALPEWHRCSTLITACINSDYITLALELPRKQADWVRSNFM